MFEFDKESQRWLPAHHPFTSPHEEDMERLVSDPASVRARYYDLAMNGLELGSGSIRIHRQDVQREIFRALGMSEEEARSRFRVFPGSTDLWNATAWGDCAGAGSHCHDPGRGAESARGHCVSQDG